MVEVRVQSLKSKLHTDQPVNQWQKWSPAFELAHMMKFVRKTSAHAVCVAGQNDVTQSRCGAAVSGASTSQQPADQATLDFYDSTSQPHRTASRYGQQRQEHSDDSDGECPQVTKNPHAALSGSFEAGMSTLTKGNDRPLQEGHSSLIATPSA